MIRTLWLEKSEIQAPKMVETTICCNCMIRKSVKKIALKPKSEQNNYQNLPIRRALHPPPAGCSGFKDRFNFTSYTFLQRWTSWSKETAKKENEVGAYTKLMNVLNALQWWQLYLPLQLYRWSHKEANLAKAQVRKHWHNCCAIYSCQSTDQTTFCHWKCEVLS